MFYLKQNKSFKNYIILSDFDRTLTTSDSPSSWDVLSTIGKFSSYYHQEVEKLHQKYRPIELDESLAINIKMNAMEKWWQSHIDLLIAQKFHKSDLKKINHNHLKLRNGVKEFLTKIAQLDIPIIIVSAGIGNVIESFFKKNNCFFKNMHIVSNYIKFENNLAIGLENKMIHSLNKNNIDFPFNINHKNIILFGDIISDIKMIPEDKQKNALKIAFIDSKNIENLTYFLNEYDIVGVDEDFNTLNEKIKLY
ncbi:MAG: hypothetical protein E7172_00735 [Firmicutes bacterium]|nr:hypothetical protein [Bacillota bacterium]